MNKEQYEVKNEVDEGCCGNIHPDTIQAIARVMPSEEDIFALADLFKVFGDSTRIRILTVLTVKEVCVCDLAEVLGMSQSAVSHQLKVLKQAKLVKARRDGKSIYYSLDDSHVKQIVDQGMEHVQEKTV